jgi:hypothetical protein
MAHELNADKDEGVPMPLRFMKRSHDPIAYSMIAVLALNSTGPALAESETISAIGAAAAGREDHPRTAELAPMSTAELQGYGCLYTGGAATLIGTFAGSSQLVLVLTGGSILSVAPIDFALAVTGTVFAGFCAVGALGAPAVVRMWHTYYDGEVVLAPK